MKVKSVAVGLTLIAFVMTLAGCGGDSKSAGEALVGVVGNDNTATTVAAPETAWTGAAPPTAADVEAALTELVACYLEAGMAGYIRFDISRSHGLYSQVTLGATQEESDAITLLKRKCDDDFEIVMTPYMVSYPETDAQREASRQRILACADELFPGQIDPDLSVDDVVIRYFELQSVGGEKGFRAIECEHEAWAGPKRHFGES